MLDPACTSVRTARQGYTHDLHDWNVMNNPQLSTSTTPAGSESTQLDHSLKAAPHVHPWAPTQTPVVVEDLSVILGSNVILHNIDLRVETGESIALLGANGSGKSTLVKTIVGLNPIAAGSVEVYGQSIEQRRSVDWRRIGYVPQRSGATSGVPATALEVVRSGLLSPSTPFADRGRAARIAAMNALEAVDLADRAHDSVQVFSGGQAQRVMIARALVREPELLFLDEPLAGIDRSSRESLAEILVELRNHGITLVTVLHEMGELYDIVERAVVLDEGSKIFDGPVDQYLDHDHAADPALVGCEHQVPHGDHEPPVHRAPVIQPFSE